MEWAMNEHHQPFEEMRHYGLKGKNFGQRENWHRYWIIGTAQFSKGTGPRDSSVRSQQSTASDHFVETTKMVVLSCRPRGQHQAVGKQCKNYREKIAETKTLFVD